ncbi:hypothetical protein PC9H_008608 [Pleurotus ostreatus]|uniref:Uncharacterized protein n=2 Tax=Pleurotus TaxID=5320 RepID=A0A8H7DT94_PLEOS|nr:uncharacterized protein PC9H_008608 [Pleurotus ostreatus]KAF7426241.1 hypothetical protein PC9H_008608 [Pleurotus ostreatus]KAG9221815.1 hypothetical protein CCMSSC00406_0006758 [Pleurotus cornucopiae]
MPRTLSPSLPCIFSPRRPDTVNGQVQLRHPLLRALFSFMNLTSGSRQPSITHMMRRAPIDADDSEESQPESEVDGSRPHSIAGGRTCDGGINCHHLKLYERDVQHLQQAHEQQMVAVSRLLRESQQQVQMLCDVLCTKKSPSDAGGVELAETVQAMLLAQEQVRMTEAAAAVDLEIREMDAVSIAETF